MWSCKFVASGRVDLESLWDLSCRPLFSGHWPSLDFGPKVEQFLLIAICWNLRRLAIIYEWSIPSVLLSLDNTNLVSSVLKFDDQMTSIRTGLVDTFSSDALSFCCDLKSSVQNATHTTSGSNKGKNISSDCCTKSATTPINPKINPTPLRSGIEAPSSIFWFSIIYTWILKVYHSMFFQNCTFSRGCARSTSF